MSDREELEIVIRIKYKIDVSFLDCLKMRLMGGGKAIEAFLAKAFEIETKTKK